MSDISEKIASLQAKQAERAELVKQLGLSVFWREQFGLSLDSQLTVRKPVIDDSQKAAILRKHEQVVNLYRKNTSTGKGLLSASLHNAFKSDRVASMPVYFLSDGEQVGELPLYSFLNEENNHD